MAKLTVVSWYDDTEDRARLLIKFDWNKMSFLDGESEDATLWRDYRDCYKIADAIKKAYELGKSWEELEIEKIEENDINSKLYH